MLRGKNIRKFGFWSIGFIVAIALIGGWYVEVFAPQRLMKHAVETTVNDSTTCDLTPERIDADAKLPWLDESKGGLDCRRIALDDAEIEICQRSLIHPDQNTDTRSLTQSQLKIRIRSRKYPINADSIIDIGGDGIAAADRDVAIASSETNIYLGWVRQLETTQQFAFVLSIIDNRTGELRPEKEIYRTTCCIVNLSMSYDRSRSKLLFTWNNWSYPDHKNMFVGILDADRLLQDDLVLVPRQLVFKDKWDKRNPYFLHDNDKIYLIYTTGDHWGWLAYTGRQSIGVYAMDDMIQPVGYYLIAAQKPLGRVLKIENGYVCYELLSQDASQVEELKKIHISKAFKVR